MYLLSIYIQKLVRKMQLLVVWAVRHSSTVMCIHMYVGSVFVICFQHQGGSFIFFTHYNYNLQSLQLHSRLPDWIPILVCFGRPSIGQFRYEYFIANRRTFFLVIWYICGHLVYFLPFWYVLTRKVWQP
jgi:hypothetical protein